MKYWRDLQRDLRHDLPRHILRDLLRNLWRDLLHDIRRDIEHDLRRDLPHRLLQMRNKRNTALQSASRMCACCCARSTTRCWSLRRCSRARHSNAMPSHACPSNAARPRNPRLERVPIERKPHDRPRPAARVLTQLRAWQVQPSELSPGPILLPSGRAERKGWADEPDRL